MRTAPCAVSRRIPVGCPLASRSIWPPCGSRLAIVILANRSARVLATARCPSTRSRMTGCPPETSSRSQRLGRAFTAHMVSSHPPPRIHSPGLAVSTLAKTRWRNSSSVLTPVRSTFNFCSPASARCRCASLNPGMTKCPPRSITCVCGPLSFSMSPFFSTAWMRSPRTAMASSRKIELNCAFDRTPV